MTDYNRIDSSNLFGYTAAGVQVVPNTNSTTLTALGCTLTSGTTYYVPLGAPKSPTPAECALNTVQVRWDAAIILTSVQIETTIFPATSSPGDGRGPTLLSDFDATAGYWLLQNPTTAYVPVTGGTQTPSTMTVTVAGGSAGGCEFDLGNFGARRARVKIVVAGTGGVVRVGAHGKVGS